MSGAPLVVLGDALLDRDIVGDVERLAPDAPVPVVDCTQTRTRPGGAGLAAALAAAGGRDVTLVTALAGDEAGAELRAALQRCGVDVVDLGLDGATPEKVRVRAAGRSLVRLDRGGPAGRVGSATAAARAAIGWAGALLVADYGRGLAAERGLRDALAARDPAVPLLWDPHPRGPAPVPRATLVTPNAAEAETFTTGSDASSGHGAASPRATTAGGSDPLGRAAARALALRDEWEAAWVCVTRGADGAVLAGEEGEVLAFPAPKVAVGDPCGAGDRFAARALAALADGASGPEAVRDAVHAASAFVAAGGAATARLGRPGMTVDAPPASPVLSRGDLAAEAEALAARVRAQGGTVVATGGCFDLLHPGHVHTLQAARALGDCLVVCLNADASVRRLKGDGRPVVSEEDRAAVLRALGCVDAVLIFDEDTPAEALARLRPHVWAKGGDYAGARLPEGEVLARWGGRAVILPFVEGRSTTTLIEEVALRGIA